MRIFQIFLSKVLILSLCLDVSGDYILINSNPNFFVANEPVRILISVTLFLLLLISLRYLKLIQQFDFRYKIVLIFIIIPILYGFFWGIINNQISLAVREFLPYLALFLIPLFYRFSEYDSLNIFYFILKILVITVFFKLIFSQFVHYIFYGGFSWKILLRISTELMLPLSFILYSLSAKHSIKFLSFYLVTIFSGIFLANARALFISSLVVIIISLKRLSFSIVVKVTFLLIVALFLSVLFSDNSFKSIFGNWSGEAFDGSYNYREKQLDIIIERFFNHTISGVGFGYFTPGYESYEEIENSYLLELDLLNFLTKVGAPFSIIYISGFVYYFILSFSSRDGSDKEKLLMLRSLNCFIFGSLIYSLFQTQHSSVIFWIFFSMAFSLNAKYLNDKFHS